MTGKQRLALRASIRRGALDAAYQRLFLGVRELWCDSTRHEWRGPEVEEECERAWVELRGVWKVRR